MTKFPDHVQLCDRGAVLAFMWSRLPDSVMLALRNPKVDYIVYQLAFARDEGGTFAWFVVEDACNSGKPYAGTSGRGRIPSRYDGKYYTAEELAEALIVEFVRSKVSA